MTQEKPAAEGEREPIETMIERSSLGTPEAKAIRAQCAPGAVDAVIKRAAELGPAWKYAGINLNPEHFETYMPEEHQAHAAHQCAEQTHLREQIQQLHSLLGQMERSADKQDEQLAAAQAENARLRGLLESLAGEWEFRSEDEPDHGDQHDFAGRVYSHCSQALRSALSASAPTKKEGEHERRG